MTTQAERRIRKGLTRSINAAINDPAFRKLLVGLGGLGDFSNNEPVHSGVADDGDLVVCLRFDGNAPLYLNVKVTVMTG